MSNELNNIAEYVHEIRERWEKYGNLARSSRSIPFEHVAKIIEYFEKDGINHAVESAMAKMEDYKLRMSRAQGANGGLQKRINKLEKEKAELVAELELIQTVKRAGKLATTLVEYALRRDDFVDASGEALTGDINFVALQVELGIEAPGDDDGA
jgi:DNA repair exonuclease SbcCD ATPase subunit